MGSVISLGADGRSERRAVNPKTLAAALGRLSPVDRALLELRYGHGVDLDELTRLAGIERERVALRCRLALRHLGADLGSGVAPDALAVTLREFMAGRDSGRKRPLRHSDRPPGAWGLAAWLVVRLRFAVIAFWIAAAVVLTMALPTIREAQVGSLGDLVPNDARAVDAEIRSSELFRFPLLSRTLVVQRDRDGLSSRELAAFARRTVALNRGEYPELKRVGGALPISNVLGKPPFSRERSTTAITYLFFSPEVSQPDAEILADRFVEQRIKPRYEGFVGVTGAIPARSAQAEEIEKALPLVELGTVLLVALVVGLYFRAIGAPLAALAAVAVSYLVSIRLIAYIGKQIGVSVPSEVEPVIVVLLFGVVTDYSIFFLSRIRRQMAEGEEPHLAAMRSSAELLPIIVTAGLTVVAASAALVVAKLGFLQAFGPGTAMAVLVGLLVAVTLVPALIAVAGKWLFWPRPPGPAAQSGGKQERAPARARRRGRRSPALRVATERPAATAAVVAVTLAVAATGVLRLELGNPLIRGLPADSETREAYAQASRGFTPGILSPTVMIVERRGLVADRDRLAALQRLLEREPGVAEVVGPADQPVGREFGAVYSRTGAAARFFVVLRGDPLGARAIRTLRRLERRMPDLLAAARLPRARAALAGDTALVAETVGGTVDDLGRVAPASLAVVLVILIVFLRAIVAPLYLLAASVLALFASLGIATYVLQDLLGFGELTYYVPIAAAVLLVSLGSDYNVFLAGQIWTESRWRPLRDAVVVAGARAATPIAIAGLVLAASFALLALVPIRPFRELAFTMAVGLLIDAFLVRTLLVPALITIVGPRSGWPGTGLSRKTRAAWAGTQPPARSPTDTGPDVPATPPPPPARRGAAL
jgi:RND superfamily putative drug exporter